MPFEELEHTADILIRVQAQTLEQLFADAAQAMFQAMFPSTGEKPILQSFTICADDIDALLQEFLSELLYISEVERIVFSSVDVKIQDSSLHAVARGGMFDPQRHSGGTEIKGISYSGLEIVKTEKGYMVDILFDV